MKRFRKILIALTGSGADRAALRWTRRIAEASGAERVDILIVDPDAADWVPEYPPVEGYEPWKERVRATAQEVAEIFAADGGPVLHTKTAVGSALPTILQELIDGDCDLVVIGVADEEDRRFAEKLARKSPASVLSVPVEAPDECRSILTPVDFSEPATYALEVASAFARSFAAKRVGCLHSFRLPRHLPGGGISRDALRDSTRKEASHHLFEFLERHGPPSLPLEPVVREGELPSIGILDELDTGRYDLVVMSTRGRSSIARALLGSNTADVIRRAPVPVLAVKVKGEGLALLKALLALGENQPAKPVATA